MKSRRILIGVAVLLALLGSIAVYAYVHTADSRAVGRTKAVSVLIVQKEIPAGTKWSDVIPNGYATANTYPEEAAPTGYVGSTSSDIEASLVAVSTVGPGQIVTRAMFAAKQLAATGALTIPDGLQAVTVALGLDADVAGFVQPGSEVAVYAIAHTTRVVPGDKMFGDDSGGQHSSKLLLPRIGVIAVSQAAPGSTTSSSGAAPNSQVLVTLAVAQTDAERLLLAQSVGKVYLTLLTSTSKSKEDGGTVNLNFTDPTNLFPAGK